MTKAAPIDLSSLDTAAACEKGFELELVHPVTKAPLGQFISVLGKDSKTFRDHIRRASNDRLRKQAMAQRRGKDADVLTIEQIEAEAIDLLVVCTTAFRDVSYKGAMLVFSEDAARKLYTEQTWIRGQVDEAVGDLELFMPA
jgi:hypothetical protein